MQTKELQNANSVYATSDLVSADGITIQGGGPLDAHNCITQPPPVDHSHIEALEYILQNAKKEAETEQLKLQEEERLQKLSLELYVGTHYFEQEYAKSREMEIMELHMQYRKNEGIHRHIASPAGIQRAAAERPAGSQGIIGPYNGDLSRPSCLYTLYEQRDWRDECLLSVGFAFEEESERSRQRKERDDVGDNIEDLLDPFFSLEDEDEPHDKELLTLDVRAAQLESEIFEWRRIKAVAVAARQALAAVEQENLAWWQDAMEDIIAEGRGFEAQRIQLERMAESPSEEESRECGAEIILGECDSNDASRKISRQQQLESFLREAAGGRMSGQMEPNGDAMSEERLGMRREAPGTPKRKKLKSAHGNRAAVDSPTINEMEVSSKNFHNNGESPMLVCVRSTKESEQEGTSKRVEVEGCGEYDPYMGF